MTRPLSRYRELRWGREWHQWETYPGALSMSPELDILSYRS